MWSILGLVGLVIMVMPTQFKRERNVRKILWELLVEILMVLQS